MNQVSIRRGKLEVSRLFLTQPVSTIGRSPVCDGILRAPGIKPVHFLLEWQGAGELNHDGAWVVFDVSSMDQSTDHPADGRVLGRDEIEFRGFRFRIHADSLASAEKIGGSIKRSLTASGGSASQVLEVLRMRQGSGAIEQVLHIDPLKNRHSALFKDIPDLKLVMEAKKKSARLTFGPTLRGGNLVGCFKGSQRISSDDDVLVESSDLVRLDIGDSQIFFRWVERPPVVQAERRVVDSKLLRGLLLGGLALLIPVVIWVVHLNQRVEPVVVKEPPRIATVEIKEAPPPPPALPVSPPTERVEKEKAMDITTAKSKVPASAAAPKFQSETVKPKAGLNAPVAPTNVNRVGLLGSLKSTASKSGPGVRADQIFNDSVVTDSVSSDSDGGILLKNPPAGTLGTGNSGDARGGRSNEIGALSTTLSGNKNFDPKSSGPIGRPGGKSDFTVGTGFGKLGIGGAGGSKGQLGSVSDGNLTVTGGLDRETVRRVIIAQRGQIQICYERALLSKPKILGLLLVRFEIIPSGQVSTARIEKSEVGSPQLESCVLGVMKGLVFPVSPNGMGTQVIYPWQFQAKG